MTTAARAADDADHPHLNAHRLRVEEQNRVARMGWLAAGALMLIGGIIVFVVMNKHQAVARPDSGHGDLGVLLKRMRACDLDTEAGCDMAIRIHAEEKTNWQNSRIANDVNQIARKASRQRGLLDNLDAIERGLAGTPSIEQLAEFHWQLRGELSAVARAAGAGIQGRLNTLRKQVGSRYLELLTTKAGAELASAKDGSLMQSLGQLEDLLLQLVLDAQDKKDTEALTAYDGRHRELFKQINELVLRKFDQAYQDRVPWMDLLAVNPEHWLATPSESMKHEFTSGGLVMTNQGEGAKSGGITYEPGRPWRDYVIDLEFKIDSGTLAFYTRVGDRMDPKIVPAFTAGTKNVNFQVEYGKSYAATVIVIGDRFKLLVDGTEQYTGESQRNMSRKGPPGIVCQPGTAFTISRLRVRWLR